MNTMGYFRSLSAETMTNSSASIVIVSNCDLITEGICSVLKDQTDLQVIAVVREEGQVLSTVSTHQPNVLMVQTDRFPEACLEMLGQVKQHCGETEMLLLLDEPTDYFILNALRVGVRGFLVKNYRKIHFLNAVRKVSGKELFFPASISQRMVHMLAGRKTENLQLALRVQLTETERQVMRLICCELSTKEIASKVHLNFRSVENIRKRIQLKIGCRNMAGIVMFAVRNGICAEGEE